uniref:Uncharacterized protein LOC111099750 n=1 Tax=Crassostrea virginica TaxID=6565 RepID=A0A8B8A604_CRAVI|nr:uncharacterized protein LOC111099750 [Crassostrea virginica]XP_022286892.1 uncharacterized protein LOC111099750 [Crassostrea virginica]XP_022286893.1 uncharacterized protein LOC111099750 [Crassostrea virginica]
MYMKTYLFILSWGLINIAFSLKCGKPLGVKSCPTTKREWQKAELKSNCSECPKENYHCVPDQHENLVEVCTKPLKLPVGMCPFYDTTGKRLQRGKCFQTKGGCDGNGNVYNTTGLYKYPVCSQTKDSSTTRSSTTACTSSIWVIVCALLFFLVLDLPDSTMFYFVE